MDARADWLASGVAALTGHPDGPPLVPPGRAASVAAGLGAVFGIDGAALLGERAALTGRTRAGRTSVGGACRLVPLSDGWAAVSCARPDDPALLGALVEHPLPEDDPWPLLRAALAGMSAAALAERATLLGVAAAPVAHPSPRPGTPGVAPAERADLRGRLVVSFAALWAGPLCAHLLRRAGAAVVTVETPRRPDGARRGEPRFHALLHHGERSVVLDPVRDRAALHALVAAADVVIEGSRPRALRAWGLQAEEAVARGTTWVSITAAGRASDRVGFGDDVAAGAGLVALDRDGLPVFVGDAIADPLTGLTAAALAVREPGVLHDVSMTAVVADTLDGTGGGPVEEAPLPRHREIPSGDPTLGADTAAVLAELGLRA
ncbi:CoA transferase [Pseudonocardia oroxyli]|uniref:CoA-transferase family III n=1 Tax=Pseudonocardia oroxyli TaxID=366584 RepID=A0A1G7JKT3_PSEOR|nr:CoA transferase [Pseudonocardia oroxyli]SDF25465.1 CoA-transferase family III [Pseudonocardia oroxyli]